ncbi:MAG: BMP family ABC transporter substrate-binding protein [Burkholderiales bacterium]|nr:BMP family ABC transporter substrate-binding protein [Burkholderiales bacterium]
MSEHPHDPPDSGRRRLLGAAGALALGGCAGRTIRAPEAGPVAAMFPGSIDDGGFFELGRRGLERVRTELGIPVRQIAGVAPEREPMLAALRGLADSEATLVIAHGAVTSDAVQRVAWEFPDAALRRDRGRPDAAEPGDLRRTPGRVGLARGRGSGTAHAHGRGRPSGRRAERTRAGRARRVRRGLRTTNSRARLLTRFTGADDDPALARTHALAVIGGGADILFAVLGAGRAGATEACRARGVRQIGAVRDWVAAAPGDHVAAAVADSGYALFMAVLDLRDNLLRGDLVKRYGVRHPAAVRLALAADVPSQVRSIVEGYRDQIAAGAIRMPEAFEGPELVHG